MKHHDARNILINRTIAVIAEEGMEKTTTKAIVSGTDINEVYIYRLFADKDDLLAKAFESLDEELVAKAMQHIAVMYMPELDYETRCRLYFFAIWKFLLGNREKCLAFIRYYYSPQFQLYSVEKHKERYAPLVSKFEEAFKREAEVWLILNHILNVMLYFAIKVHNNQMPAEDNYSEHVFRVVYASIQQYFKEKEEDSHEEGA